jgi:hypothetical protein
VSGMIDFERACPIADVPLEFETGVDSAAKVQGQSCGDVAIVFGTADADEIAKES